MLSCFLFPLAARKLRARMWLIPSRCLGCRSMYFVWQSHSWLHLTFPYLFYLSCIFLLILHIYLEELFVYLQDFSFLERGRWWIDGWIEGGREGGGMGRWIDGWWMDGWVEGWMGGRWMNRGRVGGRILSPAEVLIYHYFSKCPIRSYVLSQKMETHHPSQKPLPWACAHDLELRDPLWRQPQGPAGPPTTRISLLLHAFCGVPHFSLY